jgi:serine-type D-Ala-D-Ala carboxypeptidase/endopeptidase (penicillin-binding protein 4)
MKGNFKNSRQLLLRTAAVAVLLVASFLLFKSLIAGQSTSRQPPARSSSSDTKISSKQSFESLAHQIDQIIDESDLAAARWGVSVVNLADGREVYSRNSNRLFTPASNMKIFTTGVALDLLGPEYRWRTSVYANASPDTNGTIAADLVLYGRGAPDLIAQSKKDNHNSLAQLADDLYNRGVRRIQGNVIGDESYFSGEPLGDGWNWADVQWYFGAEASALSINRNEISVNILPPTNSVPEVRVSDPVSYVSIRNNMSAGARGKRTTLGIHRGLSDNNIHVWGELPADARGFGARLSVHNPALWAATLFHAALKAKGIAIDGSAQSRNSRLPEGQRFDPSQAVELAFVVGSPLSEIVRTTNKESNNLFAELILRTMGRERAAMVSAPEQSGRPRGDEEVGLSLMGLWLKRSQVSGDEVALHDGSGLSRLNLVTPESVSRFLVSISKTANGPGFRDSLPVSGQDGTLAGRLSSMRGQVSAKTGALIYDASLSGYLETGGGQTLAFSILCNDQTGSPSTTRLIDHIVTALATDPVWKD